MAVDRIGAGVARALDAMDDKLMAEKIIVDPGLGTPSPRARKDAGIKRIGRGEVVDRNGEVKRLQSQRTPFRFALARRRGTMKRAE